MKRLLLFSITVLLSFSGYSQAKLRDLYKKHEYAKCIEQCEKMLAKSPSDKQILFLESMCYFEMAQRPEKYADVCESPLQESLKLIGKIRTKSDADDFLKQRKDTLDILKDFTEEYAKELSTKSKIKTVRIYKAMYKAFEDNFNTLQLVEIYFRTEDYMKGIQEIDKLYNYAVPEVDASAGDSYQAMLKAPFFLVEYGMFDNAVQLSEKYIDKFRGNESVYGALQKSCIYLLDTLITSTDKMLFFEYSRKVKQLYIRDRVVMAKIYNLYMQLLNESEQNFASIENPQTWRDTLPLREFFKYSDMCKSVIQSNDFYDYEQRLIEKYHLEVPFSQQRLFAKIAYYVINDYRLHGVRCNTGMAPDVDSVVWNDEIARVATDYAHDMFAYNYADHTDRKGRDVMGRIDNSVLKGYKLNTLSGIKYVGTLKAGEAISTGPAFSLAKTDDEIRDQIETLFRKFIASKDGYCEELMGLDYTHFGLGVFGDRWVLMMLQIKVIDD